MDQLVAETLAQGAVTEACDEAFPPSVEKLTIRLSGVQPSIKTIKKRRGTLGPGKHNNARTGKVSDAEMRQKIIDVAEAERMNNGKIPWEKVKDHFPNDDVTDNKLRSIYYRYGKAQQKPFEKYKKSGKYPSRCGKCGLILEAHVCPNEHGEEKMSTNHEEANAWVEEACQMIGRRLTYGEANDFVASKRCIEKHISRTNILLVLELCNPCSDDDFINDDVLNLIEDVHPQLNGDGDDSIGLNDEDLDTSWLEDLH